MLLVATARRERVVVLLVAALAATGCTTHKSAGSAVGEMHIQGGERLSHDQPVPGVVQAHHPNETLVLAQFIVGTSGRFKIDLPAGNYVLDAVPTNRAFSPWKSKPFAVNAGRTVHVDLVEIAP
jgi:hypothetical protein